MKSYTIITHDRNGVPITKKIANDLNKKDTVYAIKHAVYGTMYGTTWVYRNYANGRISKMTLVQF